MNMVTTLLKNMTYINTQRKDIIKLNKKNKIPKKRSIFISKDVYRKEM